MKKILCLLLLTSAVMHSQIETPQASPHGKIEQKVGLTDVSVTYSRPSMRGRKIFGGLVPYNQLWRTGANENTVISFSDKVTINGNVLPKGEYAIYTIPHEDNWELKFYKTTDNWGLPQKWEESNVALATKMMVFPMPGDMKMETFTIVIDELNNNGAALNFLWENTIAMVKFEVPTEEKTMKSIQMALNEKTPKATDYYKAAEYYYEEGKDINQALAWIEKATKMTDKPPFWMLRKKSLIEAKAGKKKAAIESAKASLKGAQEAGNKDYVKMNEDSLREWGAM